MRADEIYCSSPGPLRSIIKTFVSKINPVLLWTRESSTAHK